MRYNYKDCTYLPAEVQPTKFYICICVLYIDYPFIIYIPFIIYYSQRSHCGRKGYFSFLCSLGQDPHAKVTLDS